MIVLLFFAMLGTLTISLATALQIAVCARPFRNAVERSLLLLAALFWAFRAAESLFILVSGAFPVEAAPADFLLNWIGACLLIVAIWAGLGRFEKAMTDQPRKQAIWKKG